MKISDVLWAAANEHLSVDVPNHKTWVNHHLAIESAAKTRFSFNATKNFCYALAVGGDMTFYGELTFYEFTDVRERQAARYNWLMFAYQIALEEGL